MSGTTPRDHDCDRGRDRGTVIAGFMMSWAILAELVETGIITPDRAKSMLGTAAAVVDYGDAEAASLLDQLHAQIDRIVPTPSPSLG